MPWADTHRKRQRKHLREVHKLRRCFALAYLGDGRIRWECKQGHIFVRKQKKWDPGNATLEKQLIEWCRQELDNRGRLGYWTRDGGGAMCSCPKCLQEDYDELDREIEKRLKKWRGE